MGRYKTLFENTLIFTICSFASKILVFIMLPFYTLALTKEEFGVAEIVMSTVSLLLPVLTLGISDGCMRYALDQNVDNKKVFSIGFVLVTEGAALLILSTPILMQIFVLKDYIIYFFAFYIAQAYGLLFGFFARGINKVRIVGVSGVVSTLMAVLFNILFLFVFKWGLRGYLLSFVLSYIAAALTLLIGAKLYKYITFQYDRKLAKEMLNYSLPLVPNSLSWWVNDCANRYILGFYCSVGDVGLYSAASRLPSIVNTFRSIFIQAWQLSTISEFDKDGADTFFSNIYRAYHFFIIMLVSLTILFSQLLGSVLLSNEFFEAWRFTPLLFVSVLFGSLVAYYSPSYLANKNTKKLFTSTFLGATLSVVFNLLLVPFVGVMGAAITSVISYLIIYLYLHLDSRKKLSYKTVYFRYYFSFFILLIQAFLISFLIIAPISIPSMMMVAALLFLNRDDLKDFYRFARGLVNEKKGTSV